MSTQLLLDLNKRYTNQLQKKPLLTKSLTLIFFALLNEQLASFFAGDIQCLKLSDNINIYHTLTSRVPLMGVFAGLINAPFTHYGYQLIQKLVPAPLTTRKKILQILLSTGIITPIFCAFFVSWIGIINNLKLLLNQLKSNSQNTTLKLKLINFFKLIGKIVKNSLFTNFIRVSSTSVITSPIFMLLAQKFVIPEAWSVFFAFCYFIVGTYNNTKVKLNQKRAKEEEKSEEKSEEKDKDTVKQG